MNNRVKIVCFGGGSGLSSLLSGLKRNPLLDISAVVTMFDSGGSSGELRDKFGVLPPGDIFRCILALAPDEDQATLRRIFNRRLAENHSPGNLFMFGAERVYGSYREAAEELCKAFSANGRVMPVSTGLSNLTALFNDHTHVTSEVDVDRVMREGKMVSAVALSPVVDASPESIRAIQEADVFCIGPGSFYTSVLPNFLPVGVKEALVASKAPVIFVLNLMTEGLGMKEMMSWDIVKVLEQYLGRSVDCVIMNTRIPADLPAAYAKENKFPIPGFNTRYVGAPLWLEGSLARHDPDVLSSVIWQAVDLLIRK